MHAIQSAEAMSLKEKKTQPLVPHQDQMWMIWKWRKRSLSFAKYPPNSLLALDFPPASSPASPWGTSSRSAPSQPGFQLDSAHPAGPFHLPRPTAAFWLTTTKRQSTDYLYQVIFHRCSNWRIQKGSICLGGGFQILGVKSKSYLECFWRESPKTQLSTIP